MLEDTEQLCNRILELDKSIRFAGMANNMGKLISAKFRHGLQPLLTEQELGGSIIKAVLRMKTREDYESKLGNTIYTFTLYEKVKRASIPLVNSDKEFYSLLMVSFDIMANHESLILNKILPMIGQHYPHLATQA